MKLKRFIINLCDKYPNSLWFIKKARGIFGNRSFSQFGEDLIVYNYFKSKGIKNPAYMDIGANDPYIISNTALFYIKGSRGINIEPNKVLFDYIKKCRKKDINLNVGIGDKNDTLDFYIMNKAVMSTFSKEQAEKLVSDFGMTISSIEKTELKSVMNIVDEYAGGIFPHFLSLDAEGLDYEILKSIDYERTAPLVICVETVEYAENPNGRKETEIGDLLKEKGYRIFADTHVNTIFVRE